MGEGLTKEIAGAADPTLIVGAAYYAGYDFFCVYTVDGVRYGSASAKGVPFTEEEEEELEKAPDGLPLNPDPTYSPLEMDPDDPYQTYVFEMTFADGEWVKEIRITAPQDELSEPDKFGTFTIIDCKGASLYNAANTLALHVVDDEAPEASQLGFTVTEAEFDKSAGTAELTVRRSGGKQNVVSLEYATEDGTAVSGEDYSPASGTLLFYADVDEQTIRIPLINDGVESEEQLTFQVQLSNVKGGGEEDLCTLTEGMDTVLVSLYNSNTAREENLATLLYDGEAVDLSSQVEEESGCVAPLKTEAVTGEQTAEAAEELEAVIGYGPDDIVPYTFTYSTPIRFSRRSIKDYSSNYWVTWMYTTDSQYYVYADSNQVGLGSWGSGANVVGGGRRLTARDTKSASLYIPNLSHYFCEFDGIYKFKAGGRHFIQSQFPGERPVDLLQPLAGGPDRVQRADLPGQ